MVKPKSNPVNHNLGTEHGSYQIEESLRRYGFARPILAASDGTIMAGNHVLESAAGLGFTDVVEVHTTGQSIVVHIRDDVKPDSKEATEIGYADNITQLHNFQMSLPVLQADLARGIDLKPFVSDVDLAQFAQKSEPRKKWAITVECDDETHQKELVERFEREGLRCRAR